jgi:type I restriction enzyme R subunit
MKANWATRVLFLADRNALVKQAKNAFAEYLPNVTTVDLTKEKEDSTSRIIFSTYPTIMNRIDGERSDDNRFYSIGHFDLIIIDEAHRSVYQKYKAIFDYFDALLIGLTATPKAEIDRNTYELFSLEDYTPTFSYELDKAIPDKYLVPPKAVSVPLQFQREGIKYHQLSAEEKEEYENTFRDEESGDLPEEIDSSALNAWLFNKNTVDKVLAFLMEQGEKVAGGDRLGKTIIFAKNHRHAQFIEDRFNLMFPQYSGHFLRVIDNYADYAATLIDEFSQKDKPPHIAVSVDMLDTGIDIPEIVNLVFFKAVRSHSKFWQMIGRGTRLCPDLFAPGEDKQYFKIFDFCQNFEFFEVFPDGIKASVTESLTQRIFKARLALTEELKGAGWQEGKYQEFRRELLDKLHGQIAALDQDSFVVNMRLRYVTEFRHRQRWDNLGKGDILDIELELVPLLLPEGQEELGRRFDLMLLQLQLNLVLRGKTDPGSAKKVITIAEGLSRLYNIPMVARHREIIEQAKTSGFWAQADLFAMELVRESLRALVRFLDTEKQRIVYTNFTDSISSVGEEKVLLYPTNTKESYRAKLHRYILENKNHIAVQKLQSNMPITAAELEEFERLLFDGTERGNRDTFRQELGSDTPLGFFIRSIVGLQVNAAKEAFAEFLGKGNLSSEQMQFINTLINFLTRNGSIDKGMLVDTPFTDFSDMGIYGVFSHQDAAKIISIIDRIDRNARVA